MRKNKTFPSSQVWLGLTVSYRPYVTLQYTKHKIARSRENSIKAFERKLQVFEKDIESGELKYFSNLIMHFENLTIFSDGSLNKQEIVTNVSGITATKENFSNSFLQFRKMEKTLYFLTFPDKSKFDDLDISCLQWLDLQNLEMELLEFQENHFWTKKFCDLREKLEKIECEGMKENARKSSGNIIYILGNET